MVAAILFVYAPVAIGRAPFESTMGLVQKIFYFHVPSWFAMFLSTFVCGIASISFLFTRRRGGDVIAAAAAELVVLFGLIGLVTGPLWAQTGLGRLVAVGCEADDGAGALADFRRVSAVASLWRPGIRAARGRAGAVRHGERAVRLLVRAHLADGSSAHDASCPRCRARWPVRCGSACSHF